MKARGFLTIFSLALFMALGGTYAQSGPATKTSCQVLPASQVSEIIGISVTERVMVTPSVPAGVCMYSAAGRPVLQFSFTRYDTVDLATKNFKALGMGTKLVARQKCSDAKSVTAFSRQMRYLKSQRSLKRIDAMHIRRYGVWNLTASLTEPPCRSIDAARSLSGATSAG